MFNLSPEDRLRELQEEEARLISEKQEAQKILQSEMAHLWSYHAYKIISESVKIAKEKYGEVSEQLSEQHSSIHQLLLKQAGALPSAPEYTRCKKALASVTKSIEDFRALLETSH